MLLQKVKPATKTVGYDISYCCFVVSSPLVVVCSGCVYVRLVAFLTFFLSLFVVFLLLSASFFFVCAENRSGIVLPDSAMPKLNEFKVVATGQGVRTREGSFLPLSVKVGDTVLLGESFGGQEIKIGEDKYHLFREEDILGIVEEK